MKIVVIIVATAIIIGGAAAFLVISHNDKEDNTLYEIVDAANNKIKLEKVPERIVSLDAVTTEAVCELGLVSNIVGVTSDAGVHDVTNFIYGMNFDIGYPDQLKAQIANGKTTLVGSYSSWTTDQVMMSNPDLVIIPGTANNLNKMALLQEMGITCLVVNNAYNSINVIYENMMLLGKALGKSDRAEMFVDSMKRVVEHIYSTCKGFEGKDVIVIGCWGTTLYAYNTSHLRHVILREMGCTTKMAGDATGVVTVENVLEHQPDVIIIGAVEASTNISVVKKMFESDPLWGEVKAMKTGQIYYLEYPCTQATSYTSPHIVHGIALMATIVFDEIGIDVPQLVEGEKYLDYISWIDKK